MMNRGNRGVALIMVAGVLSVLAAMATGFYVLMLMQTKSASHYTDSVRAEMMARAGVNYAVAQLRAQLFKKTEDPSNAWFGTDYLRSAKRRVSFPDSPLLHNSTDDDQDKQIDNPEEALLKPELQCSFSAARGNSANNPLDPSSPLCPTVGNPQFQAPSDRFALNITDAAGKINVNAGDNLAVMLDNLCRVIGPPLVAANLDALQPRRWGVEMDAGDPAQGWYQTALNTKDTAANRDIYYGLYDSGGTGNLVWPIWKVDPKTGSSSAPLPTVPCSPWVDRTTGRAVYGDGYAIASYRARNGAFRHLEEVKNALTYRERTGNGTPDEPLEQLEIEVKFAAIRDYITISSWVDTNTVCVGKFEWVHVDQSGGKTYAIDRDKSWVIDDPVNDPLNLRGSLRGCYLSIINGHGAGQLRRIRTNGIDWVEVDPPDPKNPAFTVTPGPISSYMIVSNEEAKLVDAKGSDVRYSYPDNPPPAGMLTFPKTKSDGTLDRGDPNDPNRAKMDYSLHPLCIHRAPVNVNTASDKVLEALFLGINVQHGHPLALGTDADVDLLRQKWKTADTHGVQPYILTPAGLKRLPAAHGWPVLDLLLDNIPLPAAPKGFAYDVSYLHNSGTLGAPNFVPLPAGGTSTLGLINDAHVLAYRIIMARQSDPLVSTLKYIDANGCPTANSITGQLRGPFKNYDDLYFRVIKPWDDKRLRSGWVDVPDPAHPEHTGIMDPGDKYHKAKLAPMLMAHFNSNTDILKFNPNIEWIDRWGRNFTAQEPVMVYTNEPPPGKSPQNWQGAWGTVPTAPPNGRLDGADVAPADTITKDSMPIYSCVPDGTAKGWSNNPTPPLASGQKDDNGKFIWGAYLTRSFRYKSDELIDKTDLNRSTTEFSFDSNGIFEIISTGQVVKNGAVLAERKFAALVKIYDVWRESTQQQFVQGTISAAYGDQKTTRGTTWSGQLARDATGLVERKGLVTLPEPLLPLRTRIVDANGNPNPLNREVVSSIGTGNTDPLNAFGKARQNPYDSGASPIVVPEVLANHILPARYDGQIVLATNTSAFDPSTGGDKDTFLASFDGDLDTATCLGNGRELAKWPYSAVPDGSGSYKYTGKGYERRCVQSIGLLGLLNGELIASDPGLPLVDGNTPYNDFSQVGQVRWVYSFYGISGALMPLSLLNKQKPDPDRPSYWNNVTLSMGSLRTDGVYLSAPGVSGNNATLKYAFTPGGTLPPNSNPSTPRHAKLNFQPDSPDGNCITMWTKTAWHHDDMRNHEFFNTGNEAATGMCSGYWFQKMGQYKFTAENINNGIGHCGNRRELNDLDSMMMFQNGSGYGTALHGGYAGVNAKASPYQESAGYYVQPFRWSFLGLRTNYRSKAPQATQGAGIAGHLATTDDWQNSSIKETPRYYTRPFIDNQLFPESKKNWDNGYAVRLRWGYSGNARWGDPTIPNTVGDARDVVGGSTTPLDPTAGGRYGEGQDAKWAWADPYGKIAEDPTKAGYSLKTFGLNNLNYGNPIYSSPFNPKSYANGSMALLWHYRQMPEDGTYAVIDELKISSKDRVLVDGAPDWDKDRVQREMWTSRYYLPPQPNSRVDPNAGGPPTFTSQTLLHSLKGFDQLKDNQAVTVVRVNWTVFTPRFMCEYKTADTSGFTTIANLTHFNTITAAQEKITVPIKGPFDYFMYNDDKYNDDKNKDHAPADNRFYSVNRPAPWNYPAGLEQANRGVEIELLEDQGSGSPKVLDKKTFDNPSDLNALGTADAPVATRASWLRYRVRFKYPVDKLCDPKGGQVVQNKPFIDPTTQYLLDTPVFDDISITYIIPTRVLDFHEVTE